MVTGRGADYIIMDDAMKPVEAMSEVRRKAVNEAFDTTIYSRLNDKANGRIIAIKQRLHPARESRETLDEIRATIGSYNFAGQYQQRPAPLEGGLVKISWIRFYDEDDRPAYFDTIIQSWDTANKAGELNSFSVCTTWGRVGDDHYLLDVYRNRVEYPGLKRARKAQAQLHGPDIILMEDKGSGIQLIQEARDEGLTVIPIKPVNDKIMRLHAQTAKFEAGHVYLPADAPWLQAYLAELTLFPASTYTDQVDSTSQALDWQGEGFPGYGTFEYYRRLARPAQTGRLPRKVKLKAPEDFGTLQTDTGKLINMSSNPIEVAAEEVEEYLRYGFTIVPKG